LDFTEKQSTDPIITLKQSSVKERKYSELSQISDNFYQLLHAEMRKMKGKEFVSSINSDCEIIIIDSNGIIKGRQILSAKFESKSFSKKNKFFAELCNYNMIGVLI